MSPVGSGWPGNHIPQGLDIVAHHLILPPLRPQLFIDIGLGYLQRLLVGYRYPRFFLVRLRSSLHGSFNLRQAVIGVQGNRLNLVLIGQLIQSQALSTNTSINIGTVVCVIFDDVSNAVILSLNFPGFQQFSKQLNLPSLYLGNKPILLFGLAYLNVLDPLGVLLCDILLTLDNGLFDQFEPLTVHLLNLVLLLRPLTHLLVLHQLPPHVEARLVRNGRKRIFEPSSLAVQLDIVEHVDGGR